MEYRVKNHTIRHTVVIELTNAPTVLRQTWDYKARYRVMPELVTIIYYGDMLDGRYEISMIGRRIRKDGSLSNSMQSVYSWGHHEEFASEIKKIADSNDPRG